MTPELRTWDVALVMPPEVAERHDFEPNADGDCICWLLGDAVDAEAAILDAQHCWADELGGEPGQYFPIIAAPVDMRGHR